MLFVNCLLQFIASLPIRWTPGRSTTRKSQERMNISFTATHIDGLLLFTFYITAAQVNSGAVRSACGGRTQTAHLSNVQRKHQHCQHNIYGLFRTLGFELPEAMLIRIFIPQSIYNGEGRIDAKCQYIYGAVDSDERDKILSFYVIDSSASADQAKQCKQLIGIISQDADAELPAIEHQCLQFKRSETSLKLQTVHLSHCSSASSSRKAQIFLYDSDVFAQLSQRYRSQQSINDDGAIGVLLRRICDAEEGKRATTGAADQTCQFRIIHHAKALKTFIHSHTTYIDSAFLKHFLLWTENLNQFTYQT